MDTNVELGLWYICMTCHRGFQEDNRLTDHKQKSHGISRKDKLAFLLGKEDLTPVVALKQCELPTKRSGPQRDLIASDPTLNISSIQKSQGICDSENYGAPEPNMLDEVDIKPALQILEIDVDTDIELSTANATVATENSVRSMEVVQSVSAAHHKSTNLANKPKSQPQRKTDDKKQRIAVSKSNDEPIRHACIHCEKTFGRSYDLKVHLRIHTNEMPYTCSICGQGFKWRSSYIYHQITHETEKAPAKIQRKIVAADVEYNPNALKCPVPDCGKTFVASSSLRYHIRELHSNSGQPTCSDCGKTFLSRSGLKGHRMKMQQIRDVRHITVLHRESSMQDESGERFSCTKCDAKFTSGFQLREHRSTAHQKTFSCSTCPKRYNNIWHLKVHEQEHIIKDQSPWLCGTCGKRFSAPDTLQIHEQNVHCTELLKGKVLECMHCGCSYNLLAALIKHEESVHTPEELSKGRSSDRYRDSANFDSDQSVCVQDGKIKCAQCPRTFRSLRKLNKHVQISHLKMNSCELCQEKFKRKYQLIDHQAKVHGLSDPDDQGGHLCITCGRIYSKLHNLNVHMSTVHRHRKKGVVTMVSCDMCGKKVPKKKLKSHRNACPLCGELPCQPVEQNGHLTKRADGVDCFKCCQCHKTYGLGYFRFHVKNHLIGEDKKESGLRMKKYLCSWCDQTFPKDEIKSHREICIYRKCSFCRQTFNKYEINIKSHRIMCSKKQKQQTSKRMKYL